jgi:hypothetical protein
VRLSEAPERAALAALRAVLEITERSLLSANPELLEETWSTQRGRSHFPSLRAAHRILARPPCARPPAPSAAIPWRPAGSAPTTAAWPW